MIGEPTVRIAFHDNHSSKLSYTQTGYLFTFSGTFGTVQNTALDDAINTLVQERHCRGGTDDICQRRQ